ncbi:MAG: EF-P beta-lysylation protein EpmB [Gammaproteobacteria bacterium]|nr:EF-P beta-lysylation protein EpmB [Gammaproteobacteria bacterium]
MITPSPVCLESTSWQRQLADAVTDTRELLHLLGLDAHTWADPPLHDSDFPLRVPRYFVDLMRPGDPDDPLLAQVLPRRRELDPTPGFDRDPVGDLAASRDHGILQKYQGRALMVTTGACAVHCRYCFRRHFPYAEASGLRDWRRALERVGQLPGTDELILSGGDPLTLSDARLGQLLTEAAGIPGLRRLRIHTRLPVVLPARITQALASMLADNRLQTVFVIHANHPNELTPTLDQALERLREADPGIWLLNQAVLLKSVNDDADTLVDLSEKLASLRVMPYYLHLLDRVAGAAHFDVDAGRARRLMAAIRARLPGYLVPALVREQAGKTGKSPVW